MLGLENSFGVEVSKFSNPTEKKYDGGIFDKKEEKIELKILSPIKIREPEFDDRLWSEYPSTVFSPSPYLSSEYVFSKYATL